MTTPDKERRPALARIQPLEPVDTPFEGDLFDRKPVAEQLTEWLGRFPDGAVLAIDAAWGDGKSWFGRHWCASLKAKAYRTIYLDAFESDYVDDPFLLLAAEFRALVASGDSAAAKSLGRRAIKVAKVLVPAVASGLIKGASRAVIGDAATAAIGEALTAAGEETAERVEEVLESRLTDLEGRRETVKAFRESLTAIAGESEHPIVVFVDELDRCRPDFAVRLLERAKHFFEVPNVVFVLLLNRQQLEAAIQGVYGAGVDAHQYLQKFLTLTVRLPKRVDLEWDSASHATRFCRALGQRLGYGGKRGFDDFYRTLGQFAQFFDMSHRQIERAFVYFGLAGNVTDSAALVAYLCAIRVSRPDVFEGLLRNDVAGHQAACDLLKDIMPRAPDAPLIELLYSAHEAGVRGGSPGTEKLKKRYDDFQRMFGHGFASDRIVWQWAKRLELTVE